MENFHYNGLMRLLPPFSGRNISWGTQRQYNPVPKSGHVIEPKERIDSVARRYPLVSDLRYQANVLIRERKDRFQGPE